MMRIEKKDGAAHKKRVERSKSEDYRGVEKMVESDELSEDKARDAWEKADDVCIKADDVWDEVDGVWEKVMSEDKANDAWFKAYDSYKKIT